MSKNNKLWDGRYLGLRLVIPIGGSLAQSYVEGNYEKINIIIAILLILLFSVIIPIIQRIYFSDWENKLINFVKKSDFRYSTLGVTSLCIVFGYVIVYSINLLTPMEVF